MLKLDVEKQKGTFKNCYSYSKVGKHYFLVHGKLHQAFPTAEDLGSDANVFSI